MRLSERVRPSYSINTHSLTDKSLDWFLSTSSILNITYIRHLSKSDLSVEFLVIEIN